MTDVRTALDLPPGYACATVARTVAQLDDQSRRMVAATAALTPADLEWQPAPGANSIGMLLAHVAYAEVHLTAVGLEGLATSDPKSLIGISEEEEGMPLAAGASPSPALAGKDIAFFHGMLARAREHLKQVARGLGEADLGREIVRTRPDGTRRVLTVDWVLYHLLEHQAMHHGQILLLAHLRRSR